MTAWRHRASLLILVATITVGAVGAGVSMALRFPGAVAKKASLPGAARLPSATRRPVASHPRRHWVVAWAAGAQAPVSGKLAPEGFRNQTIREIVVSSTKGSMIRLRVANTFGSQGLQIGRASVALQLSDAGAVAGTARTVTFGGRTSVLIPPGATVLSDPVHRAVRPLDHLLVSIYLPTATGPATEHSDARQVNYVASGDHALDPAGGAFADHTDSWFYLGGVDTLAPSSDSGAVVALGDSITDGLGSPVNANERWPNFLTRRLMTLTGRTLSVVDEGIGGNRVLDTRVCCGVSAIGRFGRDVRAQSAARIVILLEGINDIGLGESSSPSRGPHPNVLAGHLVAGYGRIIRLAHAAGIRVFAGTLTPFQGARYWTTGREATRETVNRWIRTSGAFDGVIDFARATLDPLDPDRLAPAYDSGDHLHLNAAGYRAMANAVNLAALVRSLAHR